MNKLTKKDICDKWFINKTINPLTMRKISETGAIYKKLEKKCIPKEKVKLTQKDIIKNVYTEVEQKYMR